jgi:hypothetical protein
MHSQHIVEERLIFDYLFNGHDLLDSRQQYGLVLQTIVRVPRLSRFDTTYKRTFIDSRKSKVSPHSMPPYDFYPTPYSELLSILPLGFSSIVCKPESLLPPYPH